MVAVAELRELDDDELETRLAEYRRELLNLRFQLATGQLDNSSRLSQVRKDVARALTVLRRRELGLEEEMALPTAPAPPRRRSSRRAEEPEEVDEAESLVDEDELDAPVDDVIDVEVDAGAEDEIDDAATDTADAADGDADDEDAVDADGEKGE